MEDAHVLHATQLAWPICHLKQGPLNYTDFIASPLSNQFTFSMLSGAQCTTISRSLRKFDDIPAAGTDLSTD